MTFDELRDAITAAIATRELPTIRGDAARRKLPASYLGPIISTARTTLTYQIAQRRGISLAQAAMLLRSGEDVAPYLTSMPVAAVQRARHGSGGDDRARGHRRPGTPPYSLGWRSVSHAMAACIKPGRKAEVSSFPKAGAQ